MLNQSDVLIAFLSIVVLVPVVTLVLYFTCDWDSIAEKYFPGVFDTEKNPRTK